MIDPLVQLAFNVHSQKGVYALLLGPGISRASGIPTGWEAVERQTHDRQNPNLEGFQREPNITGDDDPDTLPLSRMTSSARDHITSFNWRPPIRACSPIWS